MHSYFFSHMICLYKPSKFPKKKFPFWEKPPPKSFLRCLCKPSNISFFGKSHDPSNILFWYFLFQNPYPTPPHHCLHKPSKFPFAAFPFLAKSHDLVRHHFCIS